MSRMDICLCGNKGADQLCSNCKADQRICFRYSDFKLLAFFRDFTDRFVSDLVGNRFFLLFFFRVGAHIILVQQLIALPESKSLLRRMILLFIRITCPCNVYPHTPLLYCKTWVYRGTPIFFYPKHRLRVLFKTASLRRFLRVPTINVLSKNIKIIKIIFVLHENFNFYS